MPWTYFWGPMTTEIYPGQFKDEMEDKMNSAHNDQRDQVFNYLKLGDYQTIKVLPPGNIMFTVGNPAQEVMRISPGPPPRITVAEGVDVSEAAKAVLNCIEHMLFQARWNRSIEESDNETHASQ